MQAHLVHRRTIFILTSLGDDGIIERNRFYQMYVSNEMCSLVSTGIIILMTL